MADDPTPEEIERRAGELAHRVMTTPYQRQEWPSKAKKTKGAASRPGAVVSRQAPKPRRAGR